MHFRHLPAASFRATLRACKTSLQSRISSCWWIRFTTASTRTGCWEHHLPTMYLFWTQMLFRKPVYKGAPWPKHMVLPLAKQHFERWISLFSQTVDALFAGPKANEAKSAALSIADTFQT